MLQSRSQIYRPPVSWKNAQLLPHAKSNTTITWRFSVSFLRLPGHPVCNSKIHNTYVAATGLEPGIPGFRGVALSPACCPVVGGAAQIVMTQGVHGTMCAFGPTRRGVAKKNKILAFESAPVAKNPGPNLALVNNALFCLPFFCRAWPVGLLASGQVIGGVAQRL